MSERGDEMRRHLTERDDAWFGSLDGDWYRAKVLTREEIEEQYRLEGQHPKRLVDIRELFDEAVKLEGLQGAEDGVPNVYGCAPWRDRRFARLGEPEE